MLKTVGEIFLGKRFISKIEMPILDVITVNKARPLLYQKQGWICRMSKGLSLWPVPTLILAWFSALLDLFLPHHIVKDAHKGHTLVPVEKEGGNMKDSSEK